MMERVIDPEVFDPRLHEPDLAHYYETFDTAEWLGDTRNVVLKEGGSFGVFEYNLPGVYTGHYMFKEHRGKDAIRLSNDMLEAVKTEYGAKLIRGIIEVENRASRLLTRKLGFESYGVVDTRAGPCEIFMMNLDRLGERNKNE